MQRGDYVVITTDASRRGVFAGILVEYDDTAGTILLQQARNCLFWSKETLGFMGLAAIGPQPGSRVSPAVPEMALDGVTSVMLTTDTAKTQWELGIWNE